MNDITALFVKGRKKEVAEMAKKVMKKLTEEVEKKGLIERVACPSGTCHLSFGSTPLGDT